MCRYCATLTPAARSALHGNGKGNRNQQIRELAAKGITFTKLAATYNLSRQRIGIIVKSGRPAQPGEGMPTAQLQGES